MTSPIMRYRVAFAGLLSYVATAILPHIPYDNPTEHDDTSVSLDKVSDNREARAASRSVRPENPRQTARLVASQVWPDERQVDSFLEIIYRESRFNPRATNPTSGAYGLPQAYPADRMKSHGSDWRTNPVTQLRWMVDYIIDRYGTPMNALAHHNRKGWY